MLPAGDFDNIVGCACIDNPASESFDDSENISTGKKPRSRERGPDKKPRTYRANSMKNFEQFKERPESLQNISRMRKESTLLETLEL